MSTITVRLNKEEEELFTEYSKLYGIPISTLLKRSLEEKIEDEIDLKAILDYEKRLENNDVDYISFDEVKKKLGM